MKKHIILLVCGLLLLGLGVLLSWDAQSSIWYHTHVYWGHPEEDAKAIYVAELEAVIGFIIAAVGTALAFVGALLWVKGPQKWPL